MILLAVGSAAAMSWWVETPEEGAALAATLAALWPEESPTIQLDDGIDAPGVRLEDGVLTLSTLDGERSQPGIPDWPTAVVLVRSWSGRLAVESPPPLPPKPEPPEAPPPVRAVPWHLAALAGPASRRPDPSPAFHFTGEVGLGRAWVLPLVLDFDPAERVPMGEESAEVWTENDGVGIVRRLGVLTGTSRMIELPDRSLEVGLHGGLRWHTLVSTQDSDERSILMLPTAAARLRVWSRSPPHIGAGVMASLDGTGGDSYPDLSLYAPLREKTLAVEIGMRWQKNLKDGEGLPHSEQ